MRNATLIAAVGAALALAPPAPIALATGAAAASGHHAMMKKKTAAKPAKGEPMQNAGSVGESAATNGKTGNTGASGNTGGGK